MAAMIGFLTWYPKHRTYVAQLANGLYVRSKLEIGGGRVLVAIGTSSGTWHAMQH